MRPRSLAPPLLALLALGLAAPAQGSAAPTADAAEAGRTVVSPRPGQVVRAHRVWLRARTGKLSNRVSVRLNGTQLRRDLSFPRRGVRRLQASLSHGLRRGTNVLRVRVRPRHHAARRANVRFTAQAPSRLVGAGRDRQVSVDGTVRLRGGWSAAPGADLRWRLVAVPRAGGQPLRRPRHRRRGSPPRPASRRASAPWSRGGTRSGSPRAGSGPRRTRTRCRGTGWCRSRRWRGEGVDGTGDPRRRRDSTCCATPTGASSYYQSDPGPQDARARVQQAGTHPDPYSLPDPVSKLVIVALQPVAMRLPDRRVPVDRSSGSRHAGLQRAAEVPA